MHKSFPPLVSDTSKVLVLGSMPGQQSLQQHQYYAHPQNAFWWTVESLFGIERRRPYQHRCAALQERGVALWDVCHSCIRKGSLDSAIEASSVVPNNIPALLEEHPAIRMLFFNGHAAEKLFRKHIVLGQLQEARLKLCRLPSTSPAYAAMSREEKLDQWRIVKKSVQSFPEE